MNPAQPKPLTVVPVPAPPPEQRARREARFAPEGERRTRYSLPVGLQSSSPVGYRTRVSLTREEGQEALDLLSMGRPEAFVPGPTLTEQELFEEATLGVLSARQSTNFRGHRQVTFGPSDSARITELLAGLKGLEAPALQGATATHVVLSRPYRTPFTLLLTFIGHAPVISLATVPVRAARKRLQYVDDIPTIGFLQHLHLGILADAMERAAVIASNGARKAQVFIAPFTPGRRAENNPALRELETLCGLSVADRALGWRVALVAQVGYVPEPVAIGEATCRKLGANLLAFRSERIQPGVNQEERAPEAYHQRQDMDVPDALVEQAGRAAFNAFTHWTGMDREQARGLLLLERVDVLTPGGKDRLRAVRRELGAITERVVSNIPLWADLPLAKALTRNAARGKKAFALAGQRIYIGGISKDRVTASGVDWDLAVRACGAAAARSALVSELMGCVELPEDCDLLSGICLMAGPVNQNDIGKQFYGYPDLLEAEHPDCGATSLLVWTLKAKTVADPIGNEEQLMNPKRKGALVDLRTGPHEVVFVRKDGSVSPMRKRDGQLSQERGFSDQGNFVTDPEGQDIPGNRGQAWPRDLSGQPLW